MLRQRDRCASSFLTQKSLLDASERCRLCVVPVQAGSGLRDMHIGLSV
jgi:hypothetical protein